MAYLLLNEVVDTKKLYSSFQEFIGGTTILGVTAGIVVGISTYTFVRSTTFDILLPTLHLVLLGGLKFIHKPTYTTLSKVFGNNVKFMWLHFANELISWIVLIFATFMVVQYVFKWMGRVKMVPVKEDKDKPYFQQAPH